MHRLGDVVDVRLVEAAPVAGALRFELLSGGQLVPRGRKREASRAERRQPPNPHPGRAPGEKHRKRDKGKAGKDKPGNFKAGKAKRGKSWKR
jgi:ribonuclease R